MIDRIKGTELGFIIYHEDGSRLEIEAETMRGYSADGTELWELKNIEDGFEFIDKEKGNAKSNLNDPLYLCSLWQGAHGADRETEN